MAKKESNQPGINVRQQIEILEAEFPSLDAQLQGIVKRLLYLSKTIYKLKQLEENGIQNSNAVSG